MAFYIDDNGNLTIVQGDSGEFLVSGLPTDRNYQVYFAIQDENRNPIGSEIMVNSNYSNTVVFHLIGELTNLLTVRRGDETATYYYGVKLCDADNFLEDTLLLGNSSIGELNTITVYPRKVEGV